MKNLKLYILMIFLVTACADKTQTFDVERTLDGVKLIAPEIADPLSPVSYHQLRYPLSENQRLLLRFEELSEASEEIQVDPKNPVLIQISLDIHDRDDMRKTIENNLPLLCPLARPWMMLATWVQAHPYGPNGRWINAGGDFTKENCIKATVIEDKKDEPKDDSKNETQVSFVSLQYNVTRWFESEIKTLKQNHGWILISSEPITLFGENSLEQAPKIIWKESISSP